MYEIYEKLARSRSESNYAVSKATGVGQDTLSRWKTGKGEPSLDTLSILADYFGVSLDYMRGRTDDPTPTSKRPAHLAGLPKDVAEEVQQATERRQAAVDELAKYRTPSQEAEGDVADDLKALCDRLKTEEMIMYNGVPLSKKAVETLLASIEATDKMTSALAEAEGGKEGE